MVRPMRFTKIEAAPLRADTANLFADTNAEGKQKTCGCFSKPEMR